MSILLLTNRIYSSAHTVAETVQDASAALVKKVKKVLAANLHSLSQQLESCSKRLSDDETEKVITLESSFEVDAEEAPEVEYDEARCSKEQEKAKDILRNAGLSLVEAEELKNIIDSDQAQWFEDDVVAQLLYRSAGFRWNDEVGRLLELSQTDRLNLSRLVPILASQGDQDNLAQLFQKKEIDQEDLFHAIRRLALAPPECDPVFVEIMESLRERLVLDLLLPCNVETLQNLSHIAHNHRIREKLEAMAKTFDPQPTVKKKSAKQIVLEEVNEFTRIQDFTSENEEKWIEWIEKTPLSIDSWEKMFEHVRNLRSYDLAIVLLTKAVNEGMKVDSSYFAGFLTSLVVDEKNEYLQQILSNPIFATEIDSSLIDLLQSTAEINEQPICPALEGWTQTLNHEKPKSSPRTWSVGSVFQFLPQFLRGRQKDE